MDHYLDIRIRPDPETSFSQLMNVLAGKLHLTLCRLQASDIGVSFPRFRSESPPSLGNTLRLHGSHARLVQLMQLQWLIGMADYITVTDVLSVPPNVSYCAVRRVQTRSNAARVRRRQMKRHGWNEAEALLRIPDSVEKRLDLPFLSLRSSSTGQPFCLFIEHQPCSDRAGSGPFNTYGLSSSGTIPWF